MKDTAAFTKLAWLIVAAKQTLRRIAATNRPPRWRRSWSRVGMASAAAG